MAHLEIVDSGILYITADPSHEHVFASHPHVLPLSASEFLCTYERGHAMLSPERNTALLRSQDGGVTWHEEGFLHDRSGDDRPYSYGDGFISRMSDGTIVVITMRSDRSDPRRKFLSPTGGLIDSDNVIFVSRDDGRTWTRPQPLVLPPGLVLTPANPVIELADGRWLATFDRWCAYDDPDPNKPGMWAFFSADRGKTWGDGLVIAEVTPAGKAFWHGRTVRLNDGRLYTLIMSADISDPRRGVVRENLHYMLADSAGRHWSAPVPTPVPGQTNNVAELPDGRLGAIYTWRDAAQPGFMVMLSEDGGQTWNLERQVRVWDATGWTHLGVNAPAKWPHSHDTIAFGAPDLVATPDGDLYAAWWCTLASLTHLRWARLREVA